MILRQLLRFAGGLLLGALVATAADEQPSGARGNAPKSTETRTAPAKPALVKGMTAEQVRKIAGEPAEVRQIKNPHAKAEAWIYREVIESRTQQTATDIDVLPAFQGPGPSGEGTVNVPATRLERITVYQVTAVLMIEDRLEVTKQTREVDRAFD